MCRLRGDYRLFFAHRGQLSPLYHRQKLVSARKNLLFTFGVAHYSHYLGVFFHSEEQKKAILTAILHGYLMYLLHKGAGAVLVSEIFIRRRKLRKELLILLGDPMRSDKYRHRRGGASGFGYPAHIPYTRHEHALLSQTPVINIIVNDISEGVYPLALSFLLDSPLKIIRSALHTEAEARVFCYRNAHFFLSFFNCSGEKFSPSVQIRSNTISVIFLYSPCEPAIAEISANGILSPIMT